MARRPALAVGSPRAPARGSTQPHPSPAETPRLHGATHSSVFEDAGGGHVEPSLPLSRHAGASPDGAYAPATNDLRACRAARGSERASGRVPILNRRCRASSRAATRPATARATAHAGEAGRVRLAAKTRVGG